MKKIAWILFVLLSVFLTTWSCKKHSDNSDSNGNQTSLTDAQKASITSSFNFISAVSNPMITGNSTMVAVSQQLETFRGLPEVENAWIRDSTLYVKFKNAGIIQWYLANGYIIPPYGGKKPAKIATDRRLVGNTKACLINQQFNDESRQYCRDIINELQGSFLTQGYDVTVINGGEANINFFQNSFNKYGAVFYISHGTYDGTRTWLFTGEEPPNPQNILDELFNKFYLWWVAGKISISHCKETRNGVNSIIAFYTISDKFVESTYSQNSFPNSLIYLVACQAFKSTTQLAAAFNNKGAGVVIGWDETNCLGQSTGKLLFDLLLGGATVEGAFQALPDASKTDNCAVSSGAHLLYYPPSGKNICLVDTAEMGVTITNPLNGESVTNRVVTLSGYVSGVDYITKGVVEVNHIPTTLTYNGTDFEQPVVINNGLNTIKVICFGTRSDGRPAYGVKEITINGELPDLDLFTELRWNTDYSDVDFHLLPPGDDLSALWTSEDCYYANKVPAWGAYLDVDDINGYGPEHITIPQIQLYGTYRLFVHYYAAHSAGTTLAFVSVSVKNGPVSQFGPYSVSNAGGNNAGDLYEVCTITYPGGTITPVDHYYYLGKLKGSVEAYRDKKQPMGTYHH